MPSLEWAGKAEAVQAAKNAPYRLLLADERLSYGDLSLGNVIVQGDNLDALKSLLPYYAGQVRCVYIANLSAIKDSNWSHHTSRCCCCQFQIRIAC